MPVQDNKCVKKYKLNKLTDVYTSYTDHLKEHICVWNVDGLFESMILSERWKDNGLFRNMMVWKEYDMLERMTVCLKGWCLFERKMVCLKGW